MKLFKCVSETNTTSWTIGPFTYAYNRMFEEVGIKVAHDFITDKPALIVSIFSHKLIVRLPFGDKEHFYGEYGIRLYDSILTFLWDEKEYSKFLPFLFWREVGGRYINTKGDVCFEIDGLRRFSDPEKNDLPFICFNVAIHGGEMVIKTISYEIDLRYGHGWFSRFACIFGNRTARYIAVYRVYDGDLSMWWHTDDIEIRQNDNYDEMVSRLCAAYDWKFIGRCDQETVQ